jgi:hypothetical protein
MVNRPVGEGLLQDDADYATSFSSATVAEAGRRRAAMREGIFTLTDE